METLDAVLRYVRLEVAQRYAWQEELARPMTLLERHQIAGRTPLAEMYATMPRAEGVIRTEQDEQAVDVWRRYLEQIADADQQAADRRRDMAKELARDRLKIESDLARKLADMAEDYALREARAYEDYVLDRQKILDRYSDQVEEDNQKREDDARDLARRLEDLEQQHQNRMIDLLEARDVSGLTKEMRDYRQSRDKLYRDAADREADRARERQAREDDLAKRLAEADAEFELAKQRRAEDYAKQRAEAAEDARIRKEERKAQYDQERADLDEHLKQQKNMTRQGVFDQLAEIYGLKTGTFQMYGEMLGDLKQFLKDYEAELAGRQPSFNALLHQANAAYFRTSEMPNVPVNQTAPVAQGVESVVVQQKDWHIYGMLRAEELFQLQTGAAEMAVAAIQQQFGNVPVGVYR